MKRPSTPREPYWLDFGGPPLEPGEPQHAFCGPSHATCPSCGLALLRYAELDGSDPRLALGESAHKRLPLLFCWRCGLSQETFHYGVAGGRFEPRKFGRGPIEPDFPYDDYPAEFPAAPLRLAPIRPSDYRTLIHVREGEGCALELWKTHPHLVDPCHHTASSPLFSTDAEAPTCTRCGRSMDYLAGFGNRNTDPRGFVEQAGVQALFHHCSRCDEIAALQVCD